MARPSCKTCGYWDGGQTTAGQCRRYAPTADLAVHVLRAITGYTARISEERLKHYRVENEILDLEPPMETRTYDARAIWPITDHLDWCGDWVPLKEGSK
jgi:hypothetical protein